MSIHSIKATLRPLAVVACAGAIGLIALRGGQAQEDSSAVRSGAPPQPQPYESKSAAVPEQQALRKAHETSIKQAKALEDLTSQEREELDPQDLDRRVQQLGQSVEDSRQHLASLEAVSPTDEKTRERFDEIRENHEKASERQRLLVQIVAAPGLTPVQAAKMSRDAKDIADDMKEAEKEREKLPSAKLAEDYSSRHQP